MAGSGCATGSRPTGSEPAGAGCGPPRCDGLIRCFRIAKIDAGAGRQFGQCSEVWGSGVAAGSLNPCAEIPARTTGAPHQVAHRLLLRHVRCRVSVCARQLQVTPDSTGYGESPVNYLTMPRLISAARKSSTRPRLTPKSEWPRREAERTATTVVPGRRWSSRSSTKPSAALRHSACR